MVVNMQDREAIFGRFYHASRDHLYRYLSHYSKDQHLVQDLMQQCYLRVWERLDSISELDKALPLLKTIARNLLIDVIRKRMKHDMVWLENMQEEANALLTTTQENSISSLQALDVAIDHLPESCRTVYMMHREQGLSYKEISLRLSISVSMVEKHMSKAIRLLTQQLVTNPELLLVLVAVKRLL